MKHLIRLLLVGLLVGLAALPAVAKSFRMAGADVTVVVESDGSLTVTELLTFDFNGQFTGAYHDIPLRSSESIEVISVSDETGRYEIGGCTRIGCVSPPGTYGVEKNPGFVRIVWHHDSRDRMRTFKLVYRITGLAVAYDDVVDVNLQVWGDQWPVGLDRLNARMVLPAGAVPGEVLVWGHPYGVDGSTSLGGDGVSPTLEARNIPAEQWVEMRVVFPRRLLTSGTGALVVSGDGLDRILAEEQAFAADAEAAAAAARTGALVGAGLMLVLVLGLGGLVYLRYGREPRVDYDREYEQEPPSELTPAEVGALLSQGAVTEKEFTATLFDLIRQGAIEAEPASVEKVTWGGLRTETISDLVLSLGETQTGLRDFEQLVMTVVRRVLDEGPRPLSEFRKEIREDASANAATYQTFRERVREAVSRAGLLDFTGTRVAWVIRIGVALLVPLALVFLPRLLGGRPGGGEMAVLIAVGVVIGAVALWILFGFRRVRVRRTKEGALEAARWDAFRRYLTDFSRLEEAPVISLDLWDRYLVYAITFGVAEEVLEQARLNAPPELEEQSSIYWYGNYGYSGGHSSSAFTGLQSALSGAFVPPSSGGGGGTKAPERADWSPVKALELCPPE